MGNSDIHNCPYSFMLIIRGYPATGKSTIARRIRDTVNNTAKISVDSVINLISRCLGQDGSNHTCRVLGHIASRRLAQLFMEKGMNVILEELFIDKISVDKAVALAEQYGYHWFIFEIEAAQTDCVLRNTNSDRIPVPDLPKLLNILAEQYYHEPRAVRINTSSTGLNDAVGRIMASLQVIGPTECQPDQRIP